MRTTAWLVLMGLLAACSGVTEVTGTVDGIPVTFRDAIFGYEEWDAGEVIGLRMLLVDDLEGECIEETDPSTERITINAELHDTSEYRLITEDEPSGEYTNGVFSYRPTSESTIRSVHFGTRAIGCTDDVGGGWCTSTFATEGTMIVESSLSSLPEDFAGTVSFLFDIDVSMEGEFSARHCSSLDVGPAEGTP